MTSPRSTARSAPFAPLLMALSALGLLLTVGPSFFVFYGVITWETHAWLMVAGTALWFATAPFWIRGRDLEEAPPEDEAAEAASV